MKLNRAVNVCVCVSQSDSFNFQALNKRRCVCNIYTFACGIQKSILYARSNPIHTRTFIYILCHRSQLLNCQQTQNVFLVCYYFHSVLCEYLIYSAYMSIYGVRLQKCAHITFPIYLYASREKTFTIKV